MSCIIIGNAGIISCSGYDIVHGTVEVKIWCIIVSNIVTVNLSSHIIYDVW